jgi:hypothetical protein
MQELKMFDDKKIEDIYMFRWGDYQLTYDETDATQGDSEAQDNSDDFEMTRETFHARQAQARKNAADEERQNILKNLGVESVDDLKAVLQELQNLRESNESEAEKQEREKQEIALNFQKVTERAEKAESTLEGLQKEILEQKAFTLIKSSAKKENIKDDELIVMWLQSDRGKENYVSLFENGEIVGDAIEAIITKCKEDQPDWFKTQSPGSPSNSGKRGLSDEEKAKNLRGLAKIRM